MVAPKKTKTAADFWLRVTQLDPAALGRGEAVEIST
jgi:hypothetical protein